MMTGCFDNILVSNDKESDKKLFLKIRGKAKKVVVATKPNVRKCMHKITTLIILAITCF